MPKNFLELGGVGSSDFVSTTHRLSRNLNGVISDEVSFFHGGGKRMNLLLSREAGSEYFSALWQSDLANESLGWFFVVNSLSEIVSSLNDHGKARLYSAVNPFKAIVERKRSQVMDYSVFGLEDVVDPMEFLSLLMNKFGDPRQYEHFYLLNPICDYIVHSSLVPVQGRKRREKVIQLAMRSRFNLVRHVDKLFGETSDMPYETEKDIVSQIGRHIENLPEIENIIVSN